MEYSYMKKNYICSPLAVGNKNNIYTFKYWAVTQLPPPQFLNGHCRLTSRPFWCLSLQTSS